MDHPNYTTEHRKGQHLLSEERHEIEVRRKDGWSIYRIAKHLGRPYNTIKNEIARGTVSLYNGKVQRYKADEGKKVYREHRQNCRKQYRCLASIRFLQYVVAHLRGDDKWSLDACYGAALSSGKFHRDEMVCTKTLYNYVDLGLLPLKNIDLPEKLCRNTKRKKTNENRRILGKSIEERPEIVALREEFGHWELDSVIGKKKEGEPVVLTLTERKTRMCIWLKAKDHSADAANEVLRELFARFGDLWHEVFKTITTDNGSEFALLTELEDGCLKVYFTHPYTSCEKGTNECHNRMLRRFIPKGRSIADYSVDDICFFADCINSLPRKILGYAKPKHSLMRSLIVSMSLKAAAPRLRIGILSVGLRPPSLIPMRSTGIVTILKIVATCYCNLRKENIEKVLKSFGITDTNYSVIPYMITNKLFESRYKELSFPIITFSELTDLIKSNGRYI